MYVPMMVGLGLMTITWTTAHMHPMLDHGTYMMQSQKWYYDTLRPKAIWRFPKIGAPPNGWFIMENPIKRDDLGVPPFQETSIYSHSAGIF